MDVPSGTIHPSTLNGDTLAMKEKKKSKIVA